MSIRIGRFVEKTLTGIERAIVPIPNGDIHTTFQLSFERIPFENLIADDQQVCGIKVYADGVYMGGGKWNGGKIEGLGQRPGRRMLWSYGKWPLPKNTKEVEIVVDASRSFECNLDVDLF